MATIQRRAAARVPSSLAVEYEDAVRGGRATHRSGRLAETIADLRFGLRTLARERTFAMFVVVVLALGIGANAAMFGVLD